MIRLFHTSTFDVCDRDHNVVITWFVCAAYDHISVILTFKSAFALPLTWREQLSSFWNETALQSFQPHSRGWTTSYFLKSTFMWWKLSRSRLVADDVINAQISLELRQTPCAQLWHMTAHCPHGYCSYNSLFLYQFFHLWVVIFLTDFCSF